MYRIMIADDERDSLEGMLKCVEWQKNGFEVVATASDGNMAFKEIMDKRPDIVLLDIQMPGLSGLQVIEKVKNESSMDIAFILLSGYDYFSYAQKAIKLGVKDYLVKPFRPVDLLNSTRTAALNLKAARELITNDCNNYFAFFELHSTPEGTEENAEVFPYPMAEEIMILDYLKIASCEAASASIDNFFKALKSENIYLSNSYGFSLYLAIQRFLSEKNIAISQNYFAQCPWDNNSYFENLRDTIKLIASISCEKLSAVKEINAIAANTVRFINNNYKEDLTLENAASEVYLSPSYLSTVFKQSLGIGFVDYLNKVRINKAKQLLCSTSLKTYQVAESVGYKDSKYFSQVFRKLTGTTPSQYRAENGTGICMEDDL